MDNGLQWIAPGRRYRVQDLVFWQGQGTQSLADAAARFDTIVLGPHASAAFPRELQPFIAPGLSLRKQCDYSDCITAALGRAWAQADPHVVYIENPVSRLVLDANRAPPAQPIDGLRTFYQRLARLRAGETVSFAGVDAVRPITFAGEDVLLEPRTEDAWRQLAAVLHDAAARTVAVYRESCEDVLRTVLAQRPAGAPLRVISLHDTMNTKMRLDGAIVVERAAADRLPDWANLGNRGDAQGDPVDEPVTIDGAELRRMAAAWAQALGLDAEAGSRAVLLNRPYKGAHETLHFGAQLRALQQPAVGALQVEFRREALLGAAAVARLHAPGDDWPAPDDAHIGAIATALAAAGQALRGAPTRR